MGVHEALIGVLIVARRGLAGESYNKIFRPPRDTNSWGAGTHNNLTPGPI